jgi:RNA recognition motif. (a.k.a. RRM, RBD, or RNP domain)
MQDDDGDALDEYMSEDDGNDLGDYQRPQLKMDFSTAVVVDNLPVVKEAKSEKLMTVLKRIFSQIGEIEEDGMYMPVDESGSSYGFLFINFSTTEEAKKAVVSKLTSYAYFVLAIMATSDSICNTALTDKKLQEVCMLSRR